MGSRLFKLLFVLLIVCLMAFIGWGVSRRYISFSKGKLSFSGPFASFLKQSGKAKDAKEEKAASQEQEETILTQVRTLKAKKINFVDSLPVMGSVKGETEVDLAFEVNGVVKKINFREGEKIRKGDLIATLDPVDAELKLAYAQSKISAAKAEYNSILKQLEIHRKLYEAGAIIKSKMEQVELEVESAKYKLETAVKEAELIENEQKKINLYATKEGVMGPRKSEEGEVITPQDKLGLLFEIANVFVEVGIVERDIEKVKIGQIAKVFVDAYPNTTFEGRVEYIFPLVEGKSRTLTVKIKVPNPQSLLLPGMFARAELTIVELQNAIIVPSSAIINNEGVVFLSIIPSETIEGSPDETQTGIVQMRRVDVGYLTSDYAQITGGLKEEDLVILEAQGELKDNARVKIVGIEELTF